MNQVENRKSRKKFDLTLSTSETLMSIFTNINFNLDLTYLLVFSYS